MHSYRLSHFNRYSSFTRIDIHKYNLDTFSHFDDHNHTLDRSHVLTLMIVITVMIQSPIGDHKYNLDPTFSPIGDHDHILVRNHVRIIDDRNFNQSYSFW